MYNITDEISKAFDSNDRSVAVKCTFNENYIVDGEYIKNFTLTDTMSGDSCLTLGNTCSKQLELNMYVPDNFIGLANAKVFLEVGIEVSNEVQYVRLGTFYVDSVKTTDDYKSVSLTCYDYMAKLSNVNSYTCSCTTDDVSVIDVINDIANKYNLSVINSSIHDCVIKNPNTVNVSPRVMLGYMAGCLGCNAVIDRNGNLHIKPIVESSYTITQDVQYMGGFVKSVTSPISISYLTSGFQSEENENVFTIGTGEFGFNFSNPYMTEDIATSVLAHYENFEPLIFGDIEWRYNPCVDSGDIVLVEDSAGEKYRVIVSSQSIRLNGGISATISSNFETNIEVESLSSLKTTTITKNNTALEKIYKDVFAKLSGQNGGYIKFVFDEQGKMRAIAIPKSDVELKWDSNLGRVVTADGSKEPMWVYSGASSYYTADGGASITTATTDDGTIWATALAAIQGTIGGWSIYPNNIICTVNNDYCGLNAPNTGMAFYAGSSGDSTGNNGKFRVTHNGDLYASNANISGTINASSGKIGGFLITADQIIKESYVRVYDDVDSSVGGALLYRTAIQAYEGTEEEKAQDSGGAVNSHCSFYVYVNKWTDNGWQFDRFTYYVNNRGHLYAESAEIHGGIYAKSIQVANEVYLTNSDFGYPVKMLYAKATGNSDTEYHIGRCSQNIYGTYNYISFWESSQYRYATFHNNGIYASVLGTSDARLKNSIEEMPDKYEDFFKRLLPKRFKLNSGTSGRYHLGFVAQDVAEALEKSDISTSEFAGYVKSSFSQSEKEEYDFDDPLALKYDEFIALNTHMLQKAYKLIEKQDERITSLENRVFELEKRLNEKGI